MVASLDGARIRLHGAFDSPSVGLPRVGTADFHLCSAASRAAPRPRRPIARVTRFGIRMAMADRLHLVVAARLRAVGCVGALVGLVERLGAFFVKELVARLRVRAAHAHVACETRQSNDGSRGS